MITGVHKLRFSLFRKIQIGRQVRVFKFPLRTFVSLVTIAFIALTGTANAANWYVRPNASGSANGTNWNNAWSLGAIGNISSGDTVWMAGGTYSAWNFAGSGTSGNPITFKRATARDAAATSAAGWTASFDSQVVLPPNLSLGSYITLDGNQWTPPGLPASYGILIKVPGSPANGNYKGVSTWGQQSDTLRDIEIAGPGYCATQYETDGVYPGSGTLISGCKIHDMDTLIHAYQPISNLTIEYSILYNVGSVDWNGAGGPHPDVMYSAGGINGLLFRYNVVANVISEGIFYWNENQPNNGSNMVYFGNLFFQGNTVAAGSNFLEYYDHSNYGTVFLYNNTFVDWYKGNVFTDPSTTRWASGSTVQNNLYYNYNDDINGVTIKYNGFGGRSTAEGTNATVNAAQPFVSYKATTVGSPPQGYDPTQYISGFNLISGSWASTGGSALPGPYNVDMNGNPLGNVLGAFGATGSQVPPAPQNFRVTSQ